MNTTSEATSASVDVARELGQLRQQHMDEYFPQLAQAPTAFHIKRRMCNFTKDPYLLTHPLYFPCLAHRQGGPASLGEVYTALTSSKLHGAHALQRVAGYSMVDKARGMNCIAIDHEDALVAAGNESGSLAVYDIDELQLTSPQRLEHIEPVVVLETGRSISCVSWSAQHRDAVAIAFTFSSQVRIYDLSLVEDRSSPPKSILEVSGLGRESGHPCMTYLPYQGELLLAGSSTGHVRCWNTKKTSTRTEWNLLVDLQRSAANAKAVIAIFLLPPHLVVAVTAEGVICTLDLKNMRKPAFGHGSPEPSLVDRFDVSDLFSVRQVQLVSAKQVTHSTVLLAALSGQMVLMDVIRKVALQTIRPPSWAHSLSAQAPVPISDETSLSFEQLRDLHRRRPVAAPVQRPVTLSVWKQDVTAPVVFVAQSGRIRPLSFASAAEPFTHHSSNALHRSLTCTTLRNPQTGQWESCLRRSSEPSMTLAVSLLDAEPGFFELTVSGDLQAHLVSNLVALSCPSCSSRLRCEWWEGSERKFVDCLVAGVRPGAVQLTAPYDGIRVCGGQPKVILRTSLLPGSWPVHSTFFYQLGKHVKVIEQQGVELADVSVLATASTVPLVFAGDGQERLWIVPMRSAPVAEEEKRPSDAPVRVLEQLSVAPISLDWAPLPIPEAPLSAQIPSVSVAISPVAVSTAADEVDPDGEAAKKRQRLVVQSHWAAMFQSKS